MKTVKFAITVLLFGIFGLGCAVGISNEDSINLGTKKKNIKFSDSLKNWADSLKHSGSTLDNAVKDSWDHATAPKSPSDASEPPSSTTITPEVCRSYCNNIGGNQAGVVNGQCECNLCTETSSGRYACEPVR